MARFLPRAAVALALTVAATPAAAEWREASSEHFLIYADASEAWMRQFADRLERFDAAMRIRRPVPSRPSDRANRLVVYAVEDVDAVQRLYSRNRPSSVGGFYIPRLTAVAFTPRESSGSRTALTGQTVLFHEYAHHMMLRNATIPYPKWYVEGFAEMNAAAAIGSDGRVELGRHAGHRVGSLLNDTSLSIESLLTGEKVRNQDLFYGRAWLLTHMLSFDPARRGQLNAYFGALSKGTPNLEAAQAAFGDLRLLDRAIDSYMGRPLSFITVRADQMTIGPIAVRTLGAGEAAMMPLRMRSDRGVDAAEAKLILADARRVAAPYPNDPAVQVALAEAEYDAGNDPEAEAAADRALASDVRHQDALLYKGQALARRAKKAKVTDPAAWRQVRSWYIKATQANPDAAEPLALFYESFDQQGIAPTVNAAAAALKAFDLAPQDAGLRFQAARILLNDGKAAEARVALIPLAFNPHARGQSNFAARLVKMIDDGESAEKIAAARPEKAGEAEDGDSPDGDAKAK